MTAEDDNRETEATQLRQALADAQTQLAAWDKFFSVLRHDLRGALSPALLMADRLNMTDDPQKKRAGSIISASIDRASAILLRRVDDPPEGHDTAPTADKAV